MQIGMLGALVLFQLTAAAQPAPTPRPVVLARPVDLSTVASRVHVKQSALDGWVPKKGVPAPIEPIEALPPARYEPAPSPPRSVRDEYRDDEPDEDTGDSVNAFGSPPIPFYGTYGYGRPHFPRAMRQPRHGGGFRDAGHAPRREPVRPMQAPRMWHAGVTNR